MHSTIFEEYHINEMKNLNSFFAKKKREFIYKTKSPFSLGGTDYLQLQVLQYPHKIFFKVVAVSFGTYKFHMYHIEI